MRGLPNTSTFGRQLDSSIGHPSKYYPARRCLTSVIWRERVTTRTCSTHDLEVMSSNPGRVKLEVRSTSVQVVLEPNINMFTLSPLRACIIRTNLHSPDPEFVSPKLQLARCFKYNLCETNSEEPNLGCISLSLSRLPELLNQCYSNRPGNLENLGSDKELQP